MNNLVARLGFAIVWLYCTHYALTGVGRIARRVASVFSKS